MSDPFDTLFETFQVGFRYHTSHTSRSVAVSHLTRPPDAPKQPRSNPNTKKSDMNSPRVAPTWPFVVCLAISSAAIAQTSAPPTTTGASQDETVTLPAYVVGTQGM